MKFTNTRPEGIVVGSHEEGITILRDFASRVFDYHAWALLTIDEDTGMYSYHTRVNEPCYGGLRSYGSLSKNRPNDPWPYDLHDCPFPPLGKPVALAVPVRYYRKPYSKVSTEEWNTFVSFVVNPELSPWKLIMKDVELVEGRSFLFINLDIDPTILVNFLMWMRNTSHGAVVSFNSFRGKFPDVDVRKLFYLACSFTLKDDFLRFDDYSDNCMSPIYGNLSRIINGNPLILTEGSFANRYDYNRPEVERVFYNNNNNHDPTNPYKYFFNKGLYHRDIKEVFEVFDEILA